MKTVPVFSDCGPAGGFFTAPPPAERLQPQLRSAGLSDPNTAEEIGWRLLQPFIHPADCNIQTPFYNRRTEEWDTYRGPMNRRDTFTDLINGKTVRASYFTRNCFHYHVTGINRYFYRNRYNARFSTGFGSHKNAHKKLPFDASRFGLHGKRITELETAILLPGIDVDAHDGERDTEKTLGMLLEFFPGAYWEPSTNGRGVHVYPKLKYPVHRFGSPHGSLRYVFDLCAGLGRLLDQERLNRGYDAPIDRIRGLPTLVTIDRDEHKQPIILTSRNRDGTIKTRVQLKILCRSEVIKVPFFKGCTMDTVTGFYDAPWFDLEVFETIHDELAGDPIPEETVDSYDVADLSEDLFFEDSEDLVEQQEKKREEDNSIVCVPGSRLHKPRDYEGSIRDLATSLDSNERRFEFCLLYCQSVGRLADLPELMREYRRVGLALPRSRSDNDPAVFESRMQTIRDWMTTRFDPSKVRFGYHNYSEHRAEAEAVIRTAMAGVSLEYRHGKRIRELTVEHLAALYWALDHSQGQRQTTRFSQKQARDAVFEAIGLRTQPYAITAAFRALQAMGLIEKVGNHLAGYQATEWRVK